MSRRPWSPLSYHQCTFLFLGVRCLYRSTDNWRLFGYLLCRYLAWEPKRCLMSPLVVTELIHKASLLICIYEAHGFLWRPYLNLFISCSLCGEKNACWKKSKRTIPLWEESIFQNIFINERLIGRTEFLSQPSVWIVHTYLAHGPWASHVTLQGKSCLINL